MTCDPNTLSQLSSCLRCLTDGQLMQVKTFLLCKWGQVVVGGGGMVSEPTAIQWSWTDAGGGVVSSAVVGGACPAGADGFQLGSIASPGDPKTNIVGVAACGGTLNKSFNINDVALGAIRWTLGGIPVSGWSVQKSVTITLDPVITAYTNNITNLQGGGGGPFPNLPSLDQPTEFALDAFVKGLRSDGIWGNMIEINCVLRMAGGVDNLSLAALPLLLGPQGAPDHALLYTRLGFLEANLTANGLIGIPANGTRMVTSFQPSVSFKSDTNAGVSIYISTTTISANTIEVGAFGSGGGGACLNLSTNWSDVKLRFDCWENNDFNGELQVASPNLPGFYSCNRIAATDTRAFFANSTNAFAQQGATNNLPLGGTVASCNQALQVWCTLSNAGVPFDYTDRRISFVAFHDGLTSGQTQLLFNRVQALRVALGGGFA